MANAVPPMRLLTVMLEAPLIRHATAAARLRGSKLSCDICTEFHSAAKCSDYSQSSQRHIIRAIHIAHRPSRLIGQYTAVSCTSDWYS
mmetsp:Transcript_25048/g.50339  ORF Transcript_25048/g.50339 Transcript_25048/m.50339 type:complete len:88 (+) Transcript_25048:338-601(+)